MNKFGSRETFRPVRFGAVTEPLEPERDRTMTAPVPTKTAVQREPILGGGMAEVRHSSEGTFVDILVGGERMPVRVTDVLIVSGKGSLTGVVHSDVGGYRVGDRVSCKWDDAGARWVVVGN